ncbi:unnamed protein product [Arabis nemorensis]|uniref:Ycf20-like protein n=1 Tax=Arabis nemorensis TaxID=586526 RepID=A0A565BX54_9BRAS|nr:unnamed protein product [Arabis nemorensis]
MGVEELRNLGKVSVFLSCLQAITVSLPNCGSNFYLPKSSFRDKGASSLTICLGRMSWTMIRSSVSGGRVDPPSGSSSNKSSRRPRLIKAIQDLRTKLLVKIQEIKKDLPMKLFFLLVGFYSATAFSTFIGQTGDWDVLSAALAVIVVECIGALMYRASIPLINKMRSTITMFNYWKTGLALGLFLDSFNSDLGKQQQTPAKPGSRMYSGQQNLTSCVPSMPVKPIHEGCEDFSVIEDKSSGLKLYKSRTRRERTKPSNLLANNAPVLRLLSVKTCI